MLTIFLKDWKMLLSNQPLSKIFKLRLIALSKRLKGSNNNKRFIKSFFLNSKNLTIWIMKSKEKKMNVKMMKSSWD